MDITLDTAPLLAIEVKLSSAGRAFDKRFVRQTLRIAAEPMLVATRQEVRLGRTPQYKSNQVVRGIRKGKSRTTDGYYRRGGATRQDLRIKVVDGVGGESARVLVGVDKRKGHVGWRAHFQTRGTVKMRANDFLGRAESRTVDVVISRFGQAAQVVIQRAFSKR